MDTPVNIFHVNFLGYAHWFMSISISQLKDYLMSVDQAIYATYVMSKYLDTTTVIENSKFHETNFTHGIIFAK